jgi:hypothetical protein
VSASPINVDLSAAEDVVMSTTEFEEMSLAMHHMTETIRRQATELAQLRPIVRKLQVSQRVLRRGGIAGFGPVSR